MTPRIRRSTAVARDLAALATLNRPLTATEALRWSRLRGEARRRVRRERQLMRFQPYEIGLRLSNSFRSHELLTWGTAIAMRSLTATLAPLYAGTVIS